MKGGGELMVNREHEDYPEFKRRWQKLFEESEKEIAEVEAEEAKKPGPYGLDGPLTAVHRKYGLQFAALQKEFKHLYE